MVSVCLPSDALLQHLSSYLGFSYLGHGVSLHGCSSKAQPLLLTLDEVYLLTAALPDLQHGIAPLGMSPKLQASSLPLAPFGKLLLPWINPFSETFCHLIYLHHNLVIPHIFPSSGLFCFVLFWLLSLSHFLPQQEQKSFRSHSQVFYSTWNRC